LQNDLINSLKSKKTLTNDEKDQFERHRNLLKAKHRKLTIKERQIMDELIDTEFDLNSTKDPKIILK
jgi:hypothetical protein